MPRRTMKAGRKGTKKRGRTKRRRGGMASLLNQAIVPFGLTYLATRKGRRGSKRRGSKRGGSKRRRSRRGGSKRRRGGSRTKRGGDGGHDGVGGRRKRRKRRRSSRR